MRAEKCITTALRTFVLLVVGSVVLCQAIRWVALFRAPHSLIESEFPPAQCQLAARHFGLNKRQARFCTDPYKRFVMPAITRAAQVVAFHCPSTFGDRRWNCSSVQNLPRLTEDIKSGTREQAVVHAFSGAALLFEVARRCADGKVRYCGCGTGPQVPQNQAIFTQDLSNPSIQLQHLKDVPGVPFMIAGCHDNVEMGKQIAREFLGFHKFLSDTFAEDEAERDAFKDAWKGQSRKRPKKVPKIMKLLNAHNYMAGMVLMEKNALFKCQCHGVSGSCTQKTCFRQLTRLDSVVLQEKFKNNYLNAMKAVRTGQMELMKEVLEKNGEFSTERITREDFLFVQHSPDYCTRDLSVGSQGTHHRLCVPSGSINNSNDCANMCCGRGFYERQWTDNEKCKCRLTSGFDVSCEVCTVTKTTHHCN